MAGPLPNFIIVGAAKAGTSSLAHWLRGHPEAFVVPEKELYFFEHDERWAQGVDWYRAQFAEAGEARAVGEATPNYMFRFEAAERMASVVPGARLIALLREPGDRAYSHYWHWRLRKVAERRSFGEAVAEEMARPPRAFEDPDDRHDPQYLARGRYLPQLKRLCEYFPRESLQVLLLDDLEKRPAEAFARVCAFLGVNADVVPENVGRSYNQSFAFRPAFLARFMARYRVGRFMPGRTGALVRRLMTGPEEGYAPMGADVRATLTEHFAADNAELGEWLGRDLSHWGVPAPELAGSSA
jgi:hypothetical protein